MRKLILLAATCIAFAALLPSGALAGAGNPGGTGPPGQSCQEIFEEEGRAPGKAAESPGSPFNEPGFGSPEGGKAGKVYSERSQYDVACYHVSQHH